MEGTNIVWAFLPYYKHINILLHVMKTNNQIFLV